MGEECEVDVEVDVVESAYSAIHNLEELKLGVGQESLNVNDCTLLCVLIEAAEHLKKKDWFSENDPFAVVSRGENVSVTKVFREAGDNLTFDWPVHFREINVDGSTESDIKMAQTGECVGQPQPVEIKIMDQDSKRADDIIGTFVLDFSNEENAVLYANKYSQQQQQNPYIHGKHTSSEDRKKYCLQRTCDIYDPKKKKPSGVIKFRCWRRTWEDYLHVGLEAYLADASKRTSALPRRAKPLLRQYLPLDTFPLPVLQLDVNENRTAGFVLRLLDGKILEEFCTYQVRLWYVHEIFNGRENFKGWNQEYNAAIRIFSNTTSASLVRKAIRHEYRTLYDKREKVSGKYKRFLVEGVSDLLSRIGYKNSDYFSTSTLAMMNNRAADSHYSKMVLGPFKKVPVVGELAAPVIEQYTNSQTNLILKGSISSSASGHSANSKVGEPLAATSKKYTYAIIPETNMFHFSETAITKKQAGQDFLSKHALHSNASESVVYAGEFFIDTHSEHVLKEKSLRIIIDNNSGTYGPEKKNLWRLQKLMEANFGTGCCLALDREDEELQKLKLVNNVT